MRSGALPQLRSQDIVIEEVVELLRSCLVWRKTEKSLRFSGASACFVLRSVLSAPPLGNRGLPLAHPNSMLGPQRYPFINKWEVRQCLKSWTNAKPRGRRLSMP